MLAKDNFFNKTDPKLVEIYIFDLCVHQSLNCTGQSQKGSENVRCQTYLILWSQAHIKLRQHSLLSS